MIWLHISWLISWISETGAFTSLLVSGIICDGTPVIIVHGSIRLSKQCFSLFTEQLIVRFCLVSNYLELWFSKKFELNTCLDKTWLIFPTRIEVEPWLHGILLCISPKRTCKSIDSDVWGETWAPGRVLSKTIHWRMMTWQAQRLSQFGLDQFLEPCWHVCCPWKRSRLFGNGIRLWWEGKI